MTHITCSVPSCPSSSYVNKELKFHQFPYSEDRRKEWILACNGIHVIHEDWDFFRNKYVCSLHFDRYSYNKKGFLSRYAVPTLHLDTPMQNNNLKCAETQTESSTEVTQEDEFGSLTTRTVQCHESGHIFIQVKKIGNEEFAISSSPNVKLGVEVEPPKDDVVSEDVDMSLKDFRVNVSNLMPKKRKTEDSTNSEEEDKSISFSQFLNACDAFLPEHLREIVKTNARLYTHQNTY